MLQINAHSDSSRDVHGMHDQWFTGGVGTRSSIIGRVVWAASVSLSAVAVGALVAFALRGLLPRVKDDRPPQAITTDGRAVYVVDGDTIDVAGVRYRLTGYDTPEIYHARCAAERDRGILAAAALVGMLRGGAVTIIDGEGREKWGRRLGRLEIAGADAGAALIAAGHARAYDGQSKRGSWCQ